MSSSVSHDVYVYGQLPLCLALVAVGAGIEGMVVEGFAEVGDGLRSLLAGGVALYLVTVGATNAAMARRSRSGWWWAALASVVAVGDAVLDVPALGVVAVLAVLLVAVVVTGLEQQARGEVELERL
jgi:low temperature requirement protein LtrA